MKRWLALLLVVTAAVYFTSVRESEARGLRCRKACPPGPATVCAVPCSVTPAPAPSPPANVEPPKTVLPVPSPLPKPAVAGKLYALLLIDDAEKGSGSVHRASGAIIQRLVSNGISSNRLGKIVTITGQSLTHDKIRQALDDFPLGANDALLCYYAGAATYDDNTKTYILTPSSGAKVSRADLRAELLLQKARLTVLITDPASHPVQVEGVSGFPEAPASKSLDGLFFRHRGLADLHASSRNQSAFARDNDGGFFTLAIAQAAAQLDSGNQAGAWASFFGTATSTTTRLYRAYRQQVLDSDTVTAEDKRAYREQPTQTPTAVSPLDQVELVPVPESGAGVLPPAVAQPAQIVVRLPAGTPLLIEGEPTRQSGPVRRFETADLALGRTYAYTFRAEVSGRAAVERRVRVRAGEIAEVNFHPALIADDKKIAATTVLLRLHFLLAILMGAQ